jgi:hypothetical protein
MSNKAMIFIGEVFHNRQYPPQASTRIYQRRWHYSYLLSNKPR